MSDVIVGIVGIVLMLVCFVCIVSGPSKHDTSLVNRWSGL